MGNRGDLADAIRFWEFARIPYNLVLAAVTTVAGFVALGDGAIVFSDALALIPILIALALTANLFYCAAYPIDLIAQMTPLRALWRATRWLAWGMGTLFALVLAATLLFGFGAWPD